MTSSDLELGPAIEVEPGEVRVKRAQAVRDCPPNLCFLRIESQLGLDVLDVNDTDALGLRGRRAWRTAVGSGPGVLLTADCCRGVQARLNATSKKAASFWMCLVIKVPGF